MQELCELKGRRCIGIVPTPDSEDAFEIRDFANGEYRATSPGGAPVANARVPFPPLVAIDTSYLGVFTPWVQYYDQYTAQDVLEPCDGDIATLVAITDSVAAPWFPIAGNRRGKVLADALKYSTPREDRALLYDLVGTRTEIINSIVARAGRAPTLQGQRTAQRSATALDRLNVRWTVNVIQNQLDAGMQDFVFELNDSILWREIEAQANSILQPIIERRGLQDAYVVVDETTTTALDIDALQVNAKLFIKPARAAEFLNFDLILTPTGTDFSEVAVAG
jgi:phage tail sheath protein FI